MYFLRFGVTLKVTQLAKHSGKKEQSNFQGEWVYETWAFENSIWALTEHNLGATTIFHVVGMRDPKAFYIYILEGARSNLNGEKL